MGFKLFRGIVTGALVVGFMLAVSALSIMAQEQKPADPQRQDKSKGEKGDTPKTPAQKDVVTISGTVKAGSGTTLIVVDAQKTEHTITVTADTKVVKGEKDAALNDLKINDVVVVEAQKGSDGTLTAIKITVQG